MVNNIELYGFLHGGWHRTEIITDGQNQVIYQGKCTGNQNMASPVWCIKKTTITVVNQVETIVEQFADGDMLYDNIWDNRASLTYKYAK